MNADAFADRLRAVGYVDDGSAWVLRRGTRRIVFDTSSWMELEIVGVGRIFDVPVPEPSIGADWTLNLIEHLFATSERLALQGADPSPQFPRNSKDGAVF
ncbi:hypothetical protein [Jannaschia pohangensis]|uniref:Uncharacterized protein n=1 Tax=Jannaschia pohangensis TaxID=390807 RepID=A0A1I3QKK8_9RHOB|nr:hypothetical protein [Jannaschia pohangensis]SFJ34683.1 hypothetical protein SAMN04488095_2585 [Jannaschia pohangensis]